MIDTKRLIKLPLLKKGKVANTFSNKLEAIKIIKCSDWFIEGQEKEIFKSGDVFYPVVIETGTIVTGSF